jgi:hypothetical protein
MSGKLLDDLGKLQRSAIEVVWELGEASVHQVREELNRGGMGTRRGKRPSGPRRA